VPTESSTIEVPVSGEPLPINVNFYVVSRGQTQSLVLYWYQGHGRVVASEYRAKLFTILDSMRYRRSDTALVRVVAPITDGNSGRAASAATDFVQVLFGPLKSYLPA
jgi:EpsI family protein